MATTTETADEDRGPPQPADRPDAEDRHPPRDRRPEEGRPRVARAADARHGAVGGAPPRVEAAPLERPRDRVRDPADVHRWRSRGGADGRALRARGCRREPHRHSVLVLRRGDDGHEPPLPEGGVGLQRHRASGGRLPRGGAGRAQPEGPARVRHLRPRRAGPGRRRRSRRTSRRSCCASPGPASPSARCAASRTSRSAARRWASRARSSTPTSSKTTSGCGSSRWT